MAESLRRRMAWEWLMTHPGSSAYEVARIALRQRGPHSLMPGSADSLLKSMERAGQVTQQMGMRRPPGQDTLRQVRLWYAVPGAFGDE